MTHDHLSMLDAVKSDGLCECECAVASLVHVGLVPEDPQSMYDVVEVTSAGGGCWLGKERKRARSEERAAAPGGR